MKYPLSYYALFAQVSTLLIHLKKAVVLTICRNQRKIIEEKTPQTKHEKNVTQSYNVYLEAY